MNSNESANTANVCNRVAQQQHACEESSSSENDISNFALYNYLDSKEVKRWDLLYLLYLLSICVTDRKFIWISSRKGIH